MQGASNPNLTTLTGQSTGFQNCGGNSLVGGGSKNAGKSSQDYNQFQNDEISILSPVDRLKKEIIYTISKLINNRKFAEAGQIITRTLPLDQDLAEFLAVQKMNIRRLKSSDEHTMSSKDMSALYKLTQSRHPAVGYARALWYEVTGEILHTEIKSRNQKLVYDKISTSAEDHYAAVTTDRATLTPNPFNNVVAITVHSESSISVYDLFGKRIYHDEHLTAGENILTTATWPSGAYLIVTKDTKGRFSDTRRVIKQ